jgi:hypothetical protein
MKIKTSITLTIVFLLFSFSCKETPPEPSNGTVTNGMLTVEDVGVTDAVLRLRVPGGFKSRNITLKRDTTTIFHTPLSSAAGGQATHNSLIDTLIIDESLQPKQSYRYTLTLENIFNLKERSYADITTMDTTSHEFTWQIDTLGDGNSSALYDVAIVNDTCVYAVGEIYKKDSLGNWNNTPYNFLKWDGKNWDMKSITSVPVRSIFAFSDTDIWAGTSGPYHWDGVVWKTFKLDGAFNGYVNKFWGTSSSNMYMCGTDGALAHYDGSEWQKIESWTDVNLTDVWGSPYGKVVWACGWEDFKPTVLLRIENNIVRKVWEKINPYTLNTDSLSGLLTSVWLQNDKKLFVLSDYGIFKCQSSTKGEAKPIPFPTTWRGFPWRVRGNNLNDLFIVGEYFMIAHYNGITYKHYEELRGFGRLISIDQKNRMVVATGYSFDPIHSKGVVFIGRR